MRVNLVNIFSPTNLTECKAFFANLHEYFIPADGLILGGDFNGYESELDKFGGNTSIANYLSDFRSSFKLVDVWHKHHCKRREMSWFNSDCTIDSCLNKFLLSSKLVDLAERCDITPCCFSDHNYVNLSIDPLIFQLVVQELGSLIILCFRTRFFVIIYPAEFPICLLVCQIVVGLFQSLS